MNNNSVCKDVLSHELLSDPEWSRVRESLALSPRELEIVTLMFDGRSEAGMAERLEISVHTVHAHVRRIYRKLDVSDQRQVLLRVFVAVRSAGTTT